MALMTTMATRTALSSMATGRTTLALVLLMTVATAQIPVRSANSGRFFSELRKSNRGHNRIPINYRPPQSIEAAQLPVLEDKESTSRILPVDLKSSASSSPTVEISSANGQFSSRLGTISEKSSDQEVPQDNGFSWLKPVTDDQQDNILISRSISTYTELPFRLTYPSSFTIPAQFTIPPSRSKVTLQPNEQSLLMSLNHQLKDQSNTKTVPGHIDKHAIFLTADHFTSEQLKGSTQDFLDAAAKVTRRSEDQQPWSTPHSTEGLTSSTSYPTSKFSLSAGEASSLSAILSSLSEDGDAKPEIKQGGIQFLQQRPIASSFLQINVPISEPNTEMLMINSTTANSSTTTTASNLSQLSSNFSDLPMTGLNQSLITNNSPDSSASTNFENIESFSSPSTTPSSFLHLKEQFKNLTKVTTRPSVQSSPSEILSQDAVHNLSSSSEISQIINHFIETTFDQGFDYNDYTTDMPLLNLPSSTIYPTEELLISAITTETIVPGNFTPSETSQHKNSSLQSVSEDYSEYNATASDPSTISYLYLKEKFKEEQTSSTTVGINDDLWFSSQGKTTPASYLPLKDKFTNSTFITQVSTQSTPLYQETATTIAIEYTTTEVTSDEKNTISIGPSSIISSDFEATTETFPSLPDTDILDLTDSTEVTTPNAVDETTDDSFVSSPEVSSSDLNIQLSSQEEPGQVINDLDESSYDSTSISPSSDFETTSNLEYFSETTVPDMPQSEVTGSGIVTQSELTESTTSKSFVTSPNSSSVSVTDETIDIQTEYYFTESSNVITTENMHFQTNMENPDSDALTVAFENDSSSETNTQTYMVAIETETMETDTPDVSFDQTEMITAPSILEAVNTETSTVTEPPMIILASDVSQSTTLTTNPLTQDPVLDNDIPFISTAGSVIDDEFSTETAQTEFSSIDELDNSFSTTEIPIVNTIMEDDLSLNSTFYDTIVLQPNVVETSSTDNNQNQITSTITPDTTQSISESEESMIDSTDSPALLDMVPQTTETNDTVTGVPESPSTSDGIEIVTEQDTANATTFSYLPLKEIHKEFLSNKSSGPPNVSSLLTTTELILQETFLSTTDFPKMTTFFSYLPLKEKHKLSLNSGSQISDQPSEVINSTTLVTDLFENVTNIPITMTTFSYLDLKDKYEGTLNKSNTPPSLPLQSSDLSLLSGLLSAGSQFESFRVTNSPQKIETTLSSSFNHLKQDNNVSVNYYSSGHLQKNDIRDKSTTRQYSPTYVPLKDRIMNDLLNAKPNGNDNNQDVNQPTTTTMSSEQFIANDSRFSNRRTTLRNDLKSNSSNANPSGTLSSRENTNDDAIAYFIPESVKTNFDHRIDDTDSGSPYIPLQQNFGSLLSNIESDPDLLNELDDNDLLFDVSPKPTTPFSYHRLKEKYGTTSPPGVLFITPIGPTDEDSNGGTSTPTEASLNSLLSLKDAHNSITTLRPLTPPIPIIDLLKKTTTNSAFVVRVDNKEESTISNNTDTVMNESLYVINNPNNSTNSSSESPDTTTEPFNITFTESTDNNTSSFNYNYSSNNPFQPNYDILQQLSAIVRDVQQTGDQSTAMAPEYLNQPNQSLNKFSSSSQQLPPVENLLLKIPDYKQQVSELMSEKEKMKETNTLTVRQQIELRRQQLILEKQRVRQEALQTQQNIETNTDGSSVSPLVTFSKPGDGSSSGSSHLPSSVPFNDVFRNDLINDTNTAPNTVAQFNPLSSSSALLGSIVGSAAVFSAVPSSLVGETPVPNPPNINSGPGFSASITPLPSSAAVFTLFSSAAEVTPVPGSTTAFSPQTNSPAVFGPQTNSPALFSQQINSPAVFSPQADSSSDSSSQADPPSASAQQISSPALFSSQANPPAIFSPLINAPAIFSPQTNAPATFNPQTNTPALIPSDPSSLAVITPIPSSLAVITPVSSSLAAITPVPSLPAIFTPLPSLPSDTTPFSVYYGSLQKISNARRAPEHDRECLDPAVRYACGTCATAIMCLGTLAFAYDCTYPTSSCQKDPIFGAECKPGTLPECDCSSDEARKADPYDPSSFISCSSTETTTVESCAVDLHYSPIESQCIPQPESPSCTALGSYSNPNDCQWYFCCLWPPGYGNFQKVSIRCPDDQVFSMTDRVCKDTSDLIDNDICKSGSMLESRLDSTAFTSKPFTQRSSSELALNKKGTTSKLRSRVTTSEKTTPNNAVTTRTTPTRPTTIIPTTKTPTTIKPTTKTPTEKRSTTLRSNTKKPTTRRSTTKRTTTVRPTTKKPTTKRTTTKRTTTQRTTTRRPTTKRPTTRRPPTRRPTTRRPTTKRPTPPVRSAGQTPVLRQGSLSSSSVTTTAASADDTQTETAPQYSCPLAVVLVVYWFPGVVDYACSVL